MATCRNCKDTRIETYPKGFYAQARRCGQCFTKCLVCGGDGFIFSQDDRGRDYQSPCSCQEIDRKIELYNRAAMPAQFFDATLTNFITDHQSLTEALQIVKLSFKNYKKGSGKGLLFMGGVGVGKTRLVCTMIREFTLNYMVPCQFKEFSSLLSEIKAGYDQGVSEQNLLDSISRVEILVIDELGKGRKTDWEIQILDQIISHRYNMGKTTIFTTNYTDDPKTTYQDPASKGQDGKPETLVERVYPRIYSRLREMCDFVRLQGPDRRLSEGG